MAMPPIVREFFSLTNMIRMIPMISVTGASVEGLKKRSQAVAESDTSSRRMIWPVTVVPTFAPIMMPRD